MFDDYVEIVFSNCYGGFEPNSKLVQKFAECKGIKLYSKPSKYGIDYYTSPDLSKESYFYAQGISRTDPDLVNAVRELGPEASGMSIAKLRKGTLYKIEPYDGEEVVLTPDDGWQIA